ncbi:hypothetical protein ES703_99495 [subsurface metagenome]
MQDTQNESEQGLDKGDSLLLSSEDKADGFSILRDNRHNITLLKWSKPVAWFSAAVTEETLRAFLGWILTARLSLVAPMHSPKMGQLPRRHLHNH